MVGLAGTCSIVLVYMKKRSSVGELRSCGVRTCKVQAGGDAHVLDLEDLQDVDTCSEEGYLKLCFGHIRPL